MADRRIVVEHPDGRRVSVMESAFDDPAHNPFNHGGTVVEADANTGESRNRQQAARPLDDHQSLKDEGFEPTHRIDDEGHEIALTEK
jgi:hypothetical protein